MVPPDFAPASPLPSSLVTVPPVRPMLKRIASEFPTATSKPSKKVKKAIPPKKPSQVLARDFEEAETHSQEVGSQVGPVIPKVTSSAIVVEVTSSDTLSDPMANHLVPNLEVSPNSPWNAHKFHYHFTRPLFSKKMAAQYKSLCDPYVTLAQSMKHVVKRDALIIWPDEYQLKFQKKAFSHKNGLLKDLDTERTNLT
ncbi:hypothetical protein LIER_09355 [Lithospermum erythrorhizon]|uniref:Uncharacterized protein n=1 Tax=Lithospermum erythrorhizon TaxID=34254 RepID=A0AAV3PGK0_LITER